MIPDLWDPCGLGAIRPTSQPLICSCPPTPHNKDGATVSPYHRGGISLGTRLTWPQSSGLTGQAPGGRCVCAAAHCFNRRTRLETRVLGRELSRRCLEGSWRAGGLPAREQQPCAKAPGGREHSLARPGAWAAGCAGGCLGETGDTAAGKNLSPKQPGLGDWPSHLTLKAKVVVASTSYLHGLHRTDRPPSPLPRDPGAWRISAAGAGRGERADSLCA